MKSRDRRGRRLGGRSRCCFREKLLTERIMTKLTLWVAILPFFAITGGSAVFDCNNPAQRLTCDAPDEADKVFVCHATGSGDYKKLKVSRNSSAHVPGVAHGQQSRADQAPGASGVDVGSGPGLDCGCNQRSCDNVCTGGVAGSPC